MTKSYNESVEKSTNKTIQTFPEDEKIRFGERLKTAIGNESMLSFAKRCGLSDTLIGRYIKGTSYPSVDKLPQIAKACGKPISWFFSEEQNQTTAQMPEYNESNLMEWWEIISKAMTLKELASVVEAFKKGGKSSLFSTLLDSEVSNVKVSQASINTALILEALPEAERREILARYGINEQAGPVATKEAPHKKAG